MISDDTIIEIGKFNRPHGISGEISAVIDYDVDIDSLMCIIVKIDGINVPFFIESVRSRSAQAVLLTLDGIDNEVAAAQFSNRIIYALRQDVPQADASDDDEGGMYASDLIGYEATSTDGLLHGKIVDIDDSTANVLFIIDDPERGEVMVPVADELIDEIDSDNRRIVIDLPQGYFDV